MWWVLDELSWWLRGQRDPRSLAFDAAWGTETSRFDLHNYEPSTPDVVEAVLDALDVGPRGWTFVDLGSGKGRAVLLASRRAFDRAVGVELRRGLHEQAQVNLAAFRRRAGPVCPVDLFCGDAATHPLPDGRLVVYLYNPFPAAVVQRVLERLRGREHRLCYVNPRESPLVEAMGYRPVREHGDDTLGTWRVFAPGGR